MFNTYPRQAPAGVKRCDTADAYGPGDERGADAQGENERLIASLLDELGVRDQHPAFAEVARAREISAQQVALAWELAEDELARLSDASSS